MIGRLTQSIFRHDEAATEIYTDDPCIAVAGSEHERDNLIAMAAILWLCFGFPLSWRKGTRGNIASWIGATFRIFDFGPTRGITVEIKDDLFKSALDLLRKVMAENIVSKKVLRQLIGKLSNIANLLLPWRPFLRALYGALYADQCPNTPANCVWVKAMASPLRWLSAFFASSGGFIRREMRLDCYIGVNTVVEFIMDASPWGLAAVLLINDRVTEYFSDALSQHDLDLYEHRRGEAEGQQVWECLCALVAIRAWREKWQSSASFSRSAETMWPCSR